MPKILERLLDKFLPKGWGKEIKIKISDRLFNELKCMGEERGLKVDVTASLLLAEFDGLSLDFTKEELLRGSEEKIVIPTDPLIDGRVVDMLKIRGVTDQELNTFKKVWKLIDEYFEFGEVL